MLSILYFVSITGGSLGITVDGVSSEGSEGVTSSEFEGVLLSGINSSCELLLDGLDDELLS